MKWWRGSLAGTSKDGPAAENGVNNKTASGGTHAPTCGREATSTETTSYRCPGEYNYNDVLIFLSGFIDLRQRSTKCHRPELLSRYPDVVYLGSQQ